MSIAHWGNADISDKTHHWLMRFGARMGAASNRSSKTKRQLTHTRNPQSKTQVMAYPRTYRRVLDKVEQMQGTSDTEPGRLGLATGWAYQTRDTRGRLCLHGINVQ